MHVAHDAKINKYAEITEHTGLQVRPAVFATTGHLPVHPSTEKLLREISSHAPSAAASGAEATTGTATSLLTSLYTLNCFQSFASSLNIFDQFVFSLNFCSCHIVFAVQVVTR
jgi:hypothetical protein